MFLYSTSVHAKDCAEACGAFDSCSFIGVIEIQERFDELNQAYIAKVLSKKYHPYEYAFDYDVVNKNGEIINSKSVEAPNLDEIILVEYGVRPTGEYGGKLEIVVEDHGVAMTYVVGAKYHFFGRNIKDNIYETTKRSCTIRIK